jgi:hypothetical protein
LLFIISCCLEHSINWPFFYLGHIFWREIQKESKATFNRVKKRFAIRYRSGLNFLMKNVERGGRESFITAMEKEISFHISSARLLRVRHDKALGSLVASFIIFDDEMRKKRKTGVEKCPEKQIKGRRQCHDGNYNTSSSLTAKLTLNLIAIIPRFGPTTGIIGVNSDPLNAHACITGREEEANQVVHI